MFSGIIEAKSPVLEVQSHPELLRILVARPLAFDDIKIGDSIACNGVCLTVEALDRESLQFAIAPETLKVTGWTRDSLLARELNLERSLRFGDRLHGHLVSGHVDGVGTISKVEKVGESLEIAVLVPQELSPFFWNKGSWAVNGVSLTINHVDGKSVSSCLIPETLKRTNLVNLELGNPVNLEVDGLARGLIQFLKSRSKNLREHEGNL